MKFIISNSRWLNILFLCLLRIILDYAYIFYIVPLHGYSGYDINVSTSKYIISWLLYILIILRTPWRFTRVSDIVILFVSLAIIAPLSSLYGLSSIKIAPLLTSAVSILFYQFILNVNAKTIYFPTIRQGTLLAVSGSIIVVFIAAIHYTQVGINFNLQILDVYDFRRKNAALSDTGIFSYLNSWSFKVFNIFLLAYAILKKRLELVVICLFLQLFFFAASQHKSILLSPLLVVGAWIFFRRERNLWIITAFSLLILAISLLILAATGYILPASLLIRRALFVPASLTATYFDFFSSNPFFYWSNSFWMPFTLSSYDTTASFIIGNYLGHPEMSANIGFISSGYSQAGYVGVFVYTIMFGLLTRFVDNETKKLRVTWLGAGLFLFPLLSIWSSTDLLTGMLTHGLLLMMLLLFLIRERPRQKEKIP